jgi:hypothetical protein
MTRTVTALPGPAPTAGRPLAHSTRPDPAGWLEHVASAAACTRPIRLAGWMESQHPGTGQRLMLADTAGMPDGVIYKACGNRRASACPSCSQRYKRDAYQIVHSMLVGGDGVPATVDTHPALFVTVTAPSFGPVHTRVVKRHTCRQRSRCDCRPEPCHARRDLSVCPHGKRLVCFARHTDTDTILGVPFCLDCYDHDAQVVWNLQSGELWRRTTEGLRKYIHRLARSRNVDPSRVRLCFGKAAEMQRRAVIHFHAIIRLDGADPADPDAILPPPSGFTLADLKDAVDHVVPRTAFATPPHPARPRGWTIAWGEQLDRRVIAVSGHGQITDGMVGNYLAKYATKSTEATGRVFPRMTDETIDLYADPDGTHIERLVEACWILGRPREWRRLRRWAHMLGFGGHFLTKSRHHRVTFTLKRQQRIAYRRAVTTRPETTQRPPEQDTTLVINYLQFVGAGWLTMADATLANTSAALAREHRDAALTEATTLTA